MSAKGPTTEQGIPQTPWGFLSTLGCDLRSQEMSPGPDHAPFPAEVTPPLSPSSHTHLPPAFQRCVCFNPITSHPGRSISVFVPAPVRKAFHCPRPFLLSCPRHTYPPGRLASGVAGYDLALPVSFPPSPHAPWHTGRLWSSLWEPLVYVFLPSPKGQRAAIASDGVGKVTLGLNSTVVTG